MLTAVSSKYLVTVGARSPEHFLPHYVTGCETARGAAGSIGTYIWSTSNDSLVDSHSRYVLTN